MNTDPARVFLCPHALDAGHRSSLLASRAPAPPSLSSATQTEDGWLARLSGRSTRGMQQRQVRTAASWPSMMATPGAGLEDGPVQRRIADGIWGLSAPSSSKPRATRLERMAKISHESM
eukprot:3175289-Rhodomonas_salina.1